MQTRRDICLYTNIKTFIYCFFKEEYRGLLRDMQVVVGRDNSVAVLGLRNKPVRLKEKIEYRTIKMKNGSHVKITTEENLNIILWSFAEQFMDFIDLSKLIYVNSIEMDEYKINKLKMLKEVGV